MIQWYPAALWKLLPPAVIIGLAYWGRAYLDALGSDARTVLDSLPYLLCLISLFMANQFNRCRLMLAALGVALFYWTVQHSLQVSLDEPGAARVYLGVSLALPVLTFYLLLLPERGILNLNGLYMSAGFVALGAVTYGLAPWLADFNEASRTYYAPNPFDGYVLSRGVTLLIGLAAAVGVFVLGVRSEEVEPALLGTLAALFLALAQLHLVDISTVMSAAAAVCVAWGLLRSSHAMAYRDELTGLPGRRALNERMKWLGRSYSLAMVDVDHFKRFNDTHGHEVGDEVLRLVASRLRGIGGGGTAYRYGGEEFCIVFPRRDVEECVEPLEEVREEIANYRMALRNRSLRPERQREGSRRRGATRINSSQVSVTVSAGLAGRMEDSADAEAVLAAADQQLYKAKKAGRNRVAY
ncbi:MAG: GGDEF domain-containing protein [Pseudomonadota bacterium]